jgi:hypothetical protein
MTHILNRRQAIAGTAAVASAAMLLSRPSGAAMSSPALAPASALTTRVKGFLSGLDLAQRKAASFAWDSSTWRNWNYYGASGYVKPGLRLEQMSASQKDEAWALFNEVLSPFGLEKARNVMALQDVLMELGDGVGQRSTERFSVSVFGTPDAIGPDTTGPNTTRTWGLRLEGHHLSLSFTVRDGNLVSVTPAAFAVRPNRVTTGKHAGLNTLKGEEQLARRIFADLSPKRQARALIRASHLSNILSDAGQERNHAKKVGLPFSEFTAGQQDLAWQLIETYAVAPYAPSLASAQKARVRSGDPAGIHFAWYGANERDKSFGYRLIGDTFVIELGCIDSEAQHIHPIYHDLGNVLGRMG